MEDGKTSKTNGFTFFSIILRNQVCLFLKLSHTPMNGVQKLIWKLIIPNFPILILNVR